MGSMCSIALPLVASRNVRFLDAAASVADSLATCSTSAYLGQLKGCFDFVRNHCWVCPRTKPSTGLKCRPSASWLGFRFELGVLPPVWSRMSLTFAPPLLLQSLAIYPTLRYLCRSQVCVDSLRASCLFRLVCRWVWCLSSRLPSSSSARVESEALRYFYGDVAFFDVVAALGTRPCRGGMSALEGDSVFPRSRWLCRSVCNSGLPG
jgi:hypothetical protein